jgi:hypothetical protein
MIIVEYRRFNGAEAPVMVHERTKSAALTSLIKYEIGFGGRIIEVTPTRVVVTTTVLGCKDVVIFSGDAEEMRRLVLAAQAAACVFAEKESVRALAKGTIDAMKKCGADEHGRMRPFLSAHLVPLIAGGAVGKIALLSAMEVEGETAVRRLSPLSLDMLVELAEIAESTRTTLMESAEVLGCVA